MPITEQFIKEQLQKSGVPITVEEAKRLLMLLKEFSKIQLLSISNKNQNEKL